MGITTDQPVRIEETCAKAGLTYVTFNAGMITIREYGDEIMIVIDVTDKAVINAKAPGTIFIEPSELGDVSQ